MTSKKYTSIYCLYKELSTGKRIAKDGSVATHPVVPCKDQPEADVLKDCLNWLTARRIFHRRRSVGASDMAGRGFVRFGTPGESDIWGALADGRHFEIECKKGTGGRLSKEQQEFRDDLLLTTNAIYVIVHGVEELELYFKGLV